MIHLIVHGRSNEITEGNNLTLKSPIILLKISKLRKNRSPTLGGGSAPGFLHDTPVWSGHEEGEFVKGAAIVLTRRWEEMKGVLLRSGMITSKIYFNIHL